MITHSNLWSCEGHSYSNQHKWLPLIFLTNDSEIFNYLYAHMQSFWNTVLAMEVCASVSFQLLPLGSNYSIFSFTRKVWMNPISSSPWKTWYLQPLYFALFTVYRYLSDISCSYSGVCFHYVCFSLEFLSFHVFSLLGNFHVTWVLALWYMYHKYLSRYWVYFLYLWMLVTHMT